MLWDLPRVAPFNLMSQFSQSIHNLPPLTIGSGPGTVVLGGDRPLLILGPCVIESEEFVWEMARSLKAICAEQALPFIFKASYDKANRTSVSSFRGLGVEAGCRLLGEIGRNFGVSVTTDIHSPEEAEIAAQWIDVLQIPAFLCRQTDLIEAAARTGRTVNVKKGQFLAPQDVANIAKKLQAFGCENFFFTERGVTFGYNNLVADMRSLYWIREMGYRVVFDATHSVQRPGGGGDRTSGDGILAPVLARAAVAAGCDGVFIETHLDPSKALSDGPNQVPLAELPLLLAKLEKLHALVRQ
jgi:2-dehydro-3-deoxyphosphooctonate aldolase (KDO 8-P synthase)